MRKCLVKMETRLTFIAVVAIFMAVISSLLAGQTGHTTQKPADTQQPLAKAAKPPKTPMKAANTDAPAAAGSSNASDQWPLIKGDFSTFLASGCKPATELRTTGVLLKQDGSTQVAAADSLTICADQISFHYVRPKDEATPLFVRLMSNSATLTVPLNPATVQSDLLERRQVIGGDFCRRDNHCNCTTELLKPDAGGSCTSLGMPNFKLSQNIAGFVSDADGTPKDIRVRSLAIDAAEITFSAPASFKPAELSLSANGHAYTFPYTPAPPFETIEMVFNSDDLETICRSDANNKPDCNHTTASDVALADLTAINNGESELSAIEGHLLFTAWRGPIGQEPYAVIVTNNATKRSVVARRTLKPGQNNNFLHVDLSIMDQNIVQRNFGSRMAKRYLAVNLDVKNPTTRKLQFKKSALYFDVDYVEAKEKDSYGNFWNFVAVTSSLGLVPKSVYTPPFVKLTRDGERGPRVSRFGLEQNVKQSPVNYLAALGSFDYTTERIDAKLKGLELFGSVLSTIATGGMVAAKDTAFRDGTAVFTSTFLPGVRGLALDQQGTDRLRANLVAQTLQEVVEVPAGSTTSTIVLLPRMGILAFTDADVSVMIDRVLDVHVEPEVVTEINQTAVAKGICKPGYTKDQTREALGEPTGVSTNSDGSSTFTFSKGSVSSADFGPNGTLSSCKQRSAADQLKAATTLAEANQVLTDLGLTAATKIDLTDGSTVLTDVLGVQQSFHFDAKGNRTTDYKFAFDDIKAEEGKTKADLEILLENKASALLKDRADAIKGEADKINADADKKKATIDQQFKYSSPDVKNGSIIVTFENKDTKAGKAVKSDSTVKHVDFAGDKPKNVQ